MAYDYSRVRTATFNITKVKTGMDLDLDPEKLSWTSSGKVLVQGKARFVLPHAAFESQPYELEIEEDGTVVKCTCSDPMQRHAISLAAKERKRELAELVEDQKDRGGLRKRP